MLRSRVTWLGLLTWNAIVAFLEQCVAKLDGVLILYIVVSAALER